jgi:hypothetical protein
VPEEANVIHWIEGKLDESRVREERRDSESKNQQDKMNKEIDGMKKTLNQAQEKVITFSTNFEPVSKNNDGIDFTYYNVKK